MQLRQAVLAGIGPPLTRLGFVWDEKTPVRVRRAVARLPPHRGILRTAADAAWPKHFFRAKRQKKSPTEPRQRRNLVGPGAATRKRSKPGYRIRKKKQAALAAAQTNDLKSTLFRNADVSWIGPLLTRLGAKMLLICGLCGRRGCRIRRGDCRTPPRCLRRCRRGYRPCRRRVRIRGRTGPRCSVPNGR